MPYAGFALVATRQSSAQETPLARTQPLPQPAAQQSEARTKISVNSDLVVLPVTVKDRHGNVVPDLRKDEFRIFDDNVEQTTDIFTADALFANNRRGSPRVHPGMRAPR